MTTLLAENSRRPAIGHVYVVPKVREVPPKVEFGAHPDRVTQALGAASLVEASHNAAEAAERGATLAAGAGEAALAGAQQDEADQAA